ncbi:hypothetical protein MKZ38_006162 [Zalerion maritima]|uniref:Uncharacterized protein n=1 Tax=Zalerion maritima TaxID=339359 RepID=A0AAD5RJ94_9PEZI|nr:hypothetical protein MKZ38_006162 [Zalerion maritima]
MSHPGPSKKGAPRESTAPPRSMIGNALWMPDFYDQAGGPDKGIMRDFGGTGRDMVHILHAYMDAVDEHPSSAKARADMLRADDRVTDFELWAMMLIIRRKVLGFYWPAVDTMVEMGYVPAILTGYSDLMVVGGYESTLHPQGSTQRVLIEKFEDLAKRNRLPDALVLKAIVMGMRGEDPSKVIEVLDGAEDKWARMEQDPDNKIQFRFREHGQVAKGKMLWLSGRELEASRLFEHGTFELGNRLAGYWYARTSLTKDDPASEILMGNATTTGYEPLCVLRDMSALHSWKAARAHERGDRKEARFQAVVSRTWEKMSGVLPDYAGMIEWLCSPEKTLPPKGGRVYK